MNRKRSVAILLSVAVLSGSFGAVYAWLVPTETKITELAPGVFFRKAQTKPVFTGCNQGWIEFEDYVLVIDANFPGQAKEVIATIGRQTNKPIKFVFDTHYHGDHADGNQQYVSQGATAVAHERSLPLFNTKGIDAFQRTKRDKQEEYGDLEYVKPSLLFERKFELNDGKQKVELLHFGHSHTAGDAVAWLPEHGILFTGDACVNGAFNWTGDSNTETWIAALTEMDKLPVKIVAPGHGELGGKELIKKQRQFFIDLRTGIQKLIDAGKSLDEIKEQLDIPWYKEWTGVDVKTRVENIEHVYKELTAK